MAQNQSGDLKVVAIIQARMGSTRLPGKVLKDLAGDTVLARVVNRTRRAKLVHQVLVATSALSADDAIVRECERLRVDCFRGDEADVLDRYYRAALQSSADVIVRITADCPLIDPELIDNVISAFFEQRADYATNALTVTYPPGLDVEVLGQGALANAKNCAVEFYQRTHVTPFIYENPGQFKIVSVNAQTDYSRYRWTLDTVEDLEMIRAIYEHFAGRDDMEWTEVLKFLEDTPTLADINSMVRQKALREG
jgi:spore coat polysaccharide biosynthesis protein SpsF